MNSEQEAMSNGQGTKDIDSVLNDFLKRRNDGED